MFVLNLNKKSLMALLTTGSVLSAIAWFIFAFLPTSELANSIDFSAKTAIFVLAVSPITAILGLVSFVYALIKSCNYWCDYACEQVVIAMGGFFVLMNICNVAVYISYFISQVSLGFVAPYGGTVFENLAIMAVIFTAYNILLTVLSTIALKRN